MSAPHTLIASSRLTAKELRRLSPAERDAILSSAAKSAETEYRANSELTAFEAFGKDDLRGESANTETRRDLAD